VKNAEELADASAMFVVVRAKSNFSRHIQNSPLPNIAPNNSAFDLGADIFPGRPC
jgi:hypothetical protein